MQSNRFESLLDNLGIKDANIEMSTAGMFNEASSLGAYRNNIDSIINLLYSVQNFIKFPFMYYLTLNLYH